MFYRKRCFDDDVMRFSSVCIFCRYILVVVPSKLYINSGLPFIFFSLLNAIFCRVKLIIWLFVCVVYIFYSYLHFISALLCTFFRCVIGFNMRHHTFDVSLMQISPKFNNSHYNCFNYSFMDAFRHRSMDTRNV